MGADPHRVERVEQAEFGEFLGGVRKHVDAAAELADLPGLLEHLALDPGRVQAQRGGEPADPAADDQYPHTSALPGSRSARRICPSARASASRAAPALTPASSVTTATFASPPAAVSACAAAVRVGAGGLGQDAQLAVAQLVVAGEHVGHQVGVGASQPHHRRRRQRVEHELLRRAGLHPGGPGEHLRAGVGRHVHVDAGRDRRRRVRRDEHGVRRRARGPRPERRGRTAYARSPSPRPRGRPRRPPRRPPRPAASSSSAASDGLVSACGPPAMCATTRPGSSPNVGISSAASSTAIRPEVPAPT